MPDLYQELINLADSDMYPFHMPGHKRNLESTPMKGAFRCDITEIDGYDNLHDANGIILEAQKRANELYGSEETFFLVNGSTCGVLSALSSAVSQGGTVLVARGSHKSFYNAAYLRDFNIKYLPFRQNVEYSIPEGYLASDVEDYITDNIEAVFITSPTYEGKCSDIRGIAEACHKRGIPLIVDAAHGAHFSTPKMSAVDSNPLDIKTKDSCEDKLSNSPILYDAIPESAVTQGADIVVHSLHKTLPSMTQTALLHVQGSLIDREKLRRFLRIYQTSSPSYVMMASIDLCIKDMQKNHETFYKKLMNFRNRIQIRTSKCRYIKIPSADIIQDAAKVLISVKNATMTGQELYDILREEYKLQLEMAGEDYALAIITGWDTEEGIERFINAVNSIDISLSAVSESVHIQSAVEISLPETKMSIAKAWDLENERLSLSKALGRISGDFINLYPPGIPVIVPGEVFSKEIIDKVEGYLKDGLNVQGLSNRKEVLCVKQK